MALTPSAPLSYHSSMPRKAGIDISGTLRHIIASAEKPRLSQPAVTMAVARGKGIVKEKGLDLVSGLSGESE
ncbi:MAG: hypothetical protein A4E57_04852 [Syntrophorhabdaceae bacterium PtaU1.Bin034]|nr:MAG: hypothetical protein A4E57_04852 [Syntrophorhabdaceae bacterium PtaU1.Bin034]